MIAEIHNKLLDKLMTMAPEQLKTYLEKANMPMDQQEPGTPPLYLVAAALQGQKEKALAGSPPPPKKAKKPTVAQQLIQEAVPPPSSQTLGPPQLAAMRGPSAPAPIDGGIAALPTQEPNYAHGGVVSFAGGDWINGFGNDNEDEDALSFQMYGTPYVDPMSGQIISRAGMTPELGLKEYRSLSELNAPRNFGRQSVFTPPTPQQGAPKPNIPKAPPAADPFADAVIDKRDPRQDLFDLVGVGSSGTSGGAGDGGLSNLMGLQRQFAGVLGGPAEEIGKIAEQGKPKDLEDTYAQMQEARRIAGADQKAYDAQRARELADYESQIGKNIEFQRNIATSRAFGELANPEAKNFFDAARRAMNSYAEGMTGVMNYDTENKMLLRKLRMAQADQDFARKFNDSDALTKARKAEEDAYRELQIRAADAKGRSNASALSSAATVYNRQLAERGANDRQAMSIRAGLIKVQDTARSELAKTAARLKLSMAQLLSRDRKDVALTTLKLRQDPTVMGKADDFAQKNPNFKLNGKPVDPKEYFLQGYAREFFRKMGDYSHAASGGGNPYLMSGGFDDNQEPVDSQEFPDFGYGEDQ